MISIVVAMDDKRVIGHDNRVPWRLRADLIHLKQLTLGQPVILGRKTYESMLSYYQQSGRDMPGKLYIVVTRDPRYVPHGTNTVTVQSIEAALSQAYAEGDGEIFVIGGSAIYALVLPYTDRIYLTHVHTRTTGDRFFPDLPEDEWREISRTHHKKDEKNEYDFDMKVLERK